MFEKTKKETIAACIFFAFLHILLINFYPTYLNTLKHSYELLGIDTNFQFNRIYMDVLILVSIANQLYNGKYKSIRISLRILTIFFFIGMIYKFYYLPNFHNVILFYLSMEVTFVIIHRATKSNFFN